MATGVAKVLKVMGQHLNIVTQARAISVHHQIYSMVAMHAVTLLTVATLIKG